MLGGASLAGGRGGVVGSLLGAVNIYLITYVLATFSFGAVQSFVTDLSYGTILVLSLLITVALPYLQRRLRHVSPLLYFVVLAVITLGVILHAGFDYQHLAAASPAGSAAQAFVFEGPGLAGSTGSTSRLAKPIVFAVLLMLGVPVLLRLLVRRQRPLSLSPVVFLLAAGLVLLGVYAVKTPHALGPLVTERTS